MTFTAHNIIESLMKFRLGYKISPLYQQSHYAGGIRRLDSKELLPPTN